MQEFELASLLQIPAWTVYLFDSQAGGLNSMATFKLLIVPLLVQAMVLLPLIWWAMSNSWKAVPGWRSSDEAALGNAVPGVAIAALAAGLTWVIPLIVVSLSGVGGMAGVLRNEILVRSTILDLGAAMAIVLPCAVLSIVVARKLGRTIGDHVTSPSWFTRMLKPVLLSFVVAPGLFGSLAVSIAVISVVQQPPLTELRTTVWPLAFALVLFLVPRALLLTALLPAHGQSESGQLATLLAASTEPDLRDTAASLKWWIECRPLFLIAAVLSYWSLANLTAAALLCPPTIPLLSFDGNIVPLPVRLYKFIHQGRTATLSAMALFSTFVPLILILFVARVAPRIYMRISRADSARTS
jgi:hypothetical protein